MLLSIRHHSEESYLTLLEEVQRDILFSVYLWLEHDFVGGILMLGNAEY